MSLSRLLLVDGSSFLLLVDGVDHLLLDIGTPVTPVGSGPGWGWNFDIVRYKRHIKALQQAKEANDDKKLERLAKLDGIVKAAVFGETVAANEPPREFIEGSKVLDMAAQIGLKPKTDRPMIDWPTIHRSLDTIRQFVENDRKEMRRRSDEEDDELHLLMH